MIPPCRILRTCLVATGLAGIVLPTRADLPGPPRSAPAWAANAVNEYAAILTDVVYATADGRELLLDAWLPDVPETAKPVPTVLYFHGGGWSVGSRTTDTLMLLPWLERGWAVVNAEYRLADTSLAPAAVEDARCALRWIARVADEHGLDAGRIVLSGISAGGHLALMAAFVGEDQGYDFRCARGSAPRVAAVVNWFGVTDLEDLRAGENRRSWVVRWIGNPPDPTALARELSPLTHVRPGLPPVITVHGATDPVVPHDHAARLHSALTAAGNRNALFTVPRGGHGGFPRDHQIEAQEAIWRFLEGVLGSAPEERTEGR